MDESAYKAIYEGSPDPMWIFDEATLRFLSVNAAAVRAYGYSQDEFLEMTLKDIRPDEEVPALLASMKPEGERGAAVWKHLRKNGDELLATIFSTPTEFDGKPARAVFVRDVTSEIRARDELEALSEQLERRVSERTVELVAANTELEGFCAAVSHDLRSPLRAIDGFTRAILEEHGGTLPDEAKDYLKRVREASWRMSDLIDDLLGLTRVTRAPLNRSQVDLAKCARDIVSELRFKHEFRAFEFECPVSTPASCDQRLIVLLLTALLENCWKFTGSNASAKAEFSTEVDGEETVYVLRDNGVGFEMKYVDKLFRPFERLHRAIDFPGNGIGLATAHRIVTKHGGRIWAESSVGEGTTLRFTLEPPASPESAPSGIYLADGI